MRVRKILNASENFYGQVLTTLMQHQHQRPKLCVILRLSLLRDYPIVPLAHFVRSVTTPPDVTFCLKLDPEINQWECGWLKLGMVDHTTSTYFDAILAPTAKTLCLLQVFNLLFAWLPNSITCILCKVCVTSPQVILICLKLDPEITLWECGWLKLRS